MAQPLLKRNYLIPCLYVTLTTIKMPELRQHLYLQYVSMRHTINETITSRTRLMETLVTTCHSRWQYTAKGQET